MRVRKGIATLELIALLTGTAIAPSLANDLTGVVQQQESYVVRIGFFPKYQDAISLMNELRKLRYSSDFNLSKENGEIVCSVVLGPSYTEEDLKKIDFVPEIYFNTKEDAEKTGEQLSKEYGLPFIIKEYEEKEMALPLPHKLESIAEINPDNNYYASLDGMQLFSTLPIGIFFNGPFTIIQAGCYDEDSMWKELSEEIKPEGGYIGFRMYYKEVVVDVFFDPQMYKQEFADFHTAEFTKKNQ